MSISGRCAVLGVLCASVCGQVSLAPPAFYPGFPSPAWIRLGDLDNDGNLDVVVDYRYALGVFRNVGNGVFLPPVILVPGGTGIPEVGGFALLDWDGDGDLDIAVSVLTVPFATLRLWENDGSGQFLASAVAPATITYSTDLIPADMNGDGRIDLVAEYGSSAPGAGVLVNTPAGFVTSASLPIGVEVLTVLDADGDGDQDIATAYGSTSFGTLSLFRNNGFGGFAAATNTALNDDASALAPADVDGDGDTDLVIGRYFATGVVSVVLNNGAGSFAPPMNTPVPNGAFFVNVADFDGDGVLDIAATTIFQVSILRGLGGGTFAPPEHFPFAVHDARPEVGDLNGDGQPDFLTASNQSLIVMLNTTTPSPPANPYPGTGEDLVFASGVAGASPTTGAGEFVKTATVGSLVTLSLRSPGGTFATSPFILAVEPFAAGSPPTFPGQPALHVSPSLTILVDSQSNGQIPLVLGPGGLTVSGILPAILAGQSLMVQGAALSPMALNGLYAATDAHALVIQ